MSTRPLAILGTIVLVAACGSGAQPAGSPGPSLALEATPPPTQVATASPSVVEPTGAAPTPFPAPSDFSPDALAIGPDGTLYVSSCGAARVYRLIDAHDLEVVIGSGGSGFDTGFVGDGGPATEAQVSCPVGVAFDRAGELVVADHGNNRVRRVDANGIIQTIAGSGEAGSNRGMYGGDGGPATYGFLQEPTQIAFDTDGDLFIADRDNNRIRKVDRKGFLTTVAGDGTDAFGGDGGRATSAAIDDPAGIAIAPDGTVYFADSNNGRVRRVDPAGIIGTVAGTGAGGTTGDGGPAGAATFEDPEGLAIDHAGNLYVADTPANRVRKIDVNGVITTFAGTGDAGASGDGGPATAAMLNGPSAVAVLGDVVYIADQGNGRIRMVSPDGVITTVFGAP